MSTPVVTEIIAREQPSSTTPSSTTCASAGRLTRREHRRDDVAQRRLRALGADRLEQEAVAVLATRSTSHTVEVSGGESSCEIGWSPKPATATSPGIDSPSSAHAA